MAGGHRVRVRVSGAVACRVHGEGEFAPINPFGSRFRRLCRRKWSPPPALCDTRTTFATHLCLSGLASRISHLSSLTLAWSCAYTRIGRALEGHELAGAELAQRHPVIWFQLRLLLVSAANSAM